MNRIKVIQRMSGANRTFRVNNPEKIKFWKRMATLHGWKDGYGVKIQNER